MIDLHVTGLIAGQKTRPAKGNRSESVDVTFVSSDGETLKVNSPVAIEPSLLRREGTFVLHQFSARLVNWNDNHFLDLSCKNITGQLSNQPPK